MTHILHIDKLWGNKEKVKSKLIGSLYAAAFSACVMPGATFGDPGVAWVRLIEHQAKAQGIMVKKSLFHWTALGHPHPTLGAWIGMAAKMARVS